MSSETKTDVIRPKQVLTVPITKLAPFIHQPRRFIDDEKIMKMAETIRLYGVRQNLTIRRNPTTDGEFEVISGWRRVKAALAAGKKACPGDLIEPCDDRTAMELALMLNEQSEPLLSIEKGEYYAKMIKLYQYTVEELAARMGVTKGSISQYLSMATAPEPVKRRLASAPLVSLTHYRHIGRLKNVNRQVRAINAVQSGELETVQDTAKHVEDELLRERSEKRREQLPQLFLEPTGDPEEKKPDEPKVTDILGFLPTSVWYLKKDSPYQAIIGEVQFQKDQSDKIVVTESGRMERYPYHETNAAAVERVYKLWSREGDLVFDPFAGRTRMIVAMMMRRHFLGVEIVPGYIASLESEFKRVQQATVSNDSKVELLVGDSRSLSGIEDGFADHVFTNPPYWDVEHYERVPGQMSAAESYAEFLEMLEAALAETFRILKDGRYAVFEVKPFRRGGRYHDFPSDFTRSAEEVGFTSHDTVINVLNSPFPRLNVASLFPYRITGAMHEEFKVFVKGEPEKRAKIWTCSLCRQETTGEPHEMKGKYGTLHVCDTCHQRYYTDREQSEKTFKTDGEEDAQR